MYDPQESWNEKTPLCVGNWFWTGESGKGGIYNAYCVAVWVSKSVISFWGFQRGSLSYASAPWMWLGVFHSGSLAYPGESPRESKPCPSHAPPPPVRSKLFSATCGKDSKCPWKGKMWAWAGRCGHEGEDVGCGHDDVAILVTVENKSVRGNISCRAPIHDTWPCA